jgi:excisionase family DNA binding protein
VSPQFLRVADVAKTLGVSRSFVRSLIAEGLLPAVRATLPGRPTTKAPLLIKPADVEALASTFEPVAPRGR